MGKVIVLTPLNEALTRLIEDSIGSMGLWQILQLIVIYANRLNVAYEYLNIVHLFPAVNFTCKSNPKDRCDPNCTGWTYESVFFVDTIVSTFNLVCHHRIAPIYIETINEVSFLGGCVVFGYFADHYGRVKSFYTGVGLQIFAGLYMANSVTIFGFLALRFVSSLGTAACYVTSYAILLEIIGKKWRTTVSIFFQLPFHFGFLILPLFSIIFRPWRIFLIATMSVNFITILYVIFAGESPRWILNVGEESFQRWATDVLEMAARWNSLPTTNIKDNVESFLFQKWSEDGESSTYGKAIDFCRTRTMRNYLICVGYNFFICGSCFGIHELMEKSFEHIWKTSLIAGSVQIIGTFIAFIFTRLIGARKLLIITHCIGGITMITMSFVHLRIKTAEVISILLYTKRILYSITLPLSFLFATKVFPTVIRCSGLGICFMLSGLGTLTMLYIRTFDPTRLYNFGLGGLILVAALATSYLPETINCTFGDRALDIEIMKGS